MSGFLFPILAYEITGSPAHAALVSSAFLSGRLIVGLPAGAVADRRNRRTVIITGCLLGGGLYLVLALSLALAEPTLVALVAIAVGTGASSALVRPAESAALRAIVPTAQLPSALAQTQAREFAATLAGPPVGGLLYAATRWLPFLADALSYLFAALAALLMRADLSAPTRHDPQGSIRADIAAGLSFLWRRPVLKVIALTAMILNAAVSGLFVVLTLTLLDAGVPEAVIGVTISVGAIAGLIGAITAPLVINRLATGRLIALSAVLIIAGLAPLALTTAPVVVAALLAVAFLSLPALNSSIEGYLIAVTPAELQGRVSAGLDFAASAASPLGPLVAGAAMAAYGATSALAGTAVLIALGCSILLGNREVRTLPKPELWPAS